MNNHLKLVIDFLVSLRTRGAQCLLAFCALVFLVSCNKDDGNGTLPPAGNPADENVPAQHTCGTPNVHNPDLNYGSMTDQEGNVYKTIVIGTQEWMAENLNTSTYRNGDAIPTNLSDDAWLNTTSGA